MKLTAKGVSLVVVDALNCHYVGLWNNVISIQMSGRVATHRIRGSRADTSHNGYQDVFLDVEWAGVERNAKNLVVRDKLGPCTADRKRNKLGDDLAQQSAPCS